MLHLASILIKAFSRFLSMQSRKSYQFNGLLV